MMRESKDQDYHPRGRSVDGELSTSSHQGMLPPPSTDFIQLHFIGPKFCPFLRISHCQELVLQVSPVLPLVSQLCQESLACGRAFGGPNP
jgi:hypothetical protein